MSEVHGEHSESFYSVYSHESAFNYVQTRQPEPAFNGDSNQFANRQASPIRMTKMAQSNINLDDCALEIEQNSSEAERKSYETLGNIQRVRNEIKRQREMMNIVKEGHRQNEVQMEEVHNISEIQPNQNKELQQSICLLKQIDCLSVEQVSPEELREIKKKIQTLKKEQFTLQSSLLMAGEMLKSAKSRNTILEQQLVRYRRIEEQKSLAKEPTKPKINFTPSNPQKQTRSFPQTSPSSSPTLQPLKSLYKECSINDSFCIYQNEGYKIEVLYEREKHVSEEKMLILCVKLTPHHHIVGKRVWRFGLEIDRKVDAEDRERLEKVMKSLSYDGGMIIQQYTAWPEDKFHIIALIHELDQSKNHHHTHTVLIPLPITHFFEPRLVALYEAQLSAVKKSLSEYSLALSGSISVDNMEKMKEMWWFGRFVSCLGWNQIVFIQFGAKEEKEIKQELIVKVYGKSDGKIVAGVIEFLSFFLTN